MAWRELRPVLDDELNRLPEKYRTPLVLCYLEGKTYRAVAEELGNSLGTVSTLITRGRALLRTRLTRRGVELSAAVLTVLLARATGAAAHAALIENLTHAVALLGTGLAAAGVSPSVLVLTHGVLRTMFLAKIQSLVCVSVAAVLVAAITCGLVHPLVSAQTPGPDGGGASSRKPDDGAEADWRERLTLQASSADDPRAILSITISPDGKLLATAGEDRAIRIWDFATGKQMHQLVGPAPQSVRSVSFSPDGKLLASAGADGVISFWDFDGSGRASQLQDLKAHTTTVKSVAFSPDGTLLASAGDDPVIIVWEVRQRIGKVRWSSRGERVKSLTFTPDGRSVLSAGVDQSVRLWDVSTGKEIRRFVGHQGAVLSVAVSPDGKRAASGGQDRTVRLWDITTGKELVRFEEDKQAAALAFSPDGKLLAVGGDNVIRLLDAATGKVVVTLRGHKDRVWTITFTPDGKAVVSGSADGTVRIWEPAKPAAWWVKAPAAKSDDRLDQLVAALAKSDKTDDQLCEALYLATLARFPTEIEAKTVREQFARKKDRKQALEDVLFALTATKEFNANVQSMTQRNPWGQLPGSRTP